MDDLERDRSFLTSNEKKMIVRVHQYFLSIRQRQTQRQDLSLRKEVASVLGIGEATVARVVAEYNGSKNEEFSRQTIQGRPKKGLDHNVVELVHKFVMSANVSGSPLSTHTLRQKLEENNQNGSYFVYFICWDIITAVVNAEICCMSYWETSLFVVVIYDIGLKTYRQIIARF